jgi:cytochrome c-type biogenesis protein CcmE
VTPRRQRMIFVAVILAGVGLATALALTAVGENMLYFYSPSQLRAGEAPTDHTVRIGGLVVDDSVKRDAGSLKVSFGLSDGANAVTVEYTGILPDLFREGQGIVARGALGRDGLFVAEEVLAKHDENYMPPEVAEAIKMAQENGTPMPVSPHAGGSGS